MINRTVMPLSDACRRIGAEYNRLHRAVVAGRVPAERDRGGSRWLVREEDLPTIAKVLGIELPEYRSDSGA